ncbi:AmpG family muropeptide MFS transporter [Chitinolyticbacter albus]|uniref:AmpG family muropeptide MFS transporter n=1 Tax=Chitinolyticbacter albus TaxID=2961951 RepID=UPI00210A3AD4|nr:MFS transporter [Chitinolyticbacter albus]
MSLATYTAVFTNRRMAAVLLLGFASGLPLALTGQAMQSWLTSDGLDLKTIGLLALVGMPYTYKFLWAPLMDRFELPGLGRRKGWLLITQLALGVLLLSMAGLQPGVHTGTFALFALGVAFFSASQDVVVDAYRVDVSHDDERGAAAAVGVLGYRLAMLTSGGLAFLMAEAMGWGRTYAMLGGVMLGLAVIVQLIAPRLAYHASHSASEFARFIAALLLLLAAAITAAWQQQGAFAPLAAVVAALLVNALVGSRLFGEWRHLNGFLAMLAGAWLGYMLAQRGLVALGQLAGWPDFVPDSQNNWTGLLFVLAEIGAAVPLALYGAQLARFELLITPMQQYFRREHAWAFLLLIVLYKLGDAFAGVLSVAFLQQGVGFSLGEIGVVNKIVGMVATIFGGIVGGLLMVRLRLYRSLLAFGILQIVSNVGYWALAIYGKGALGSVHLPLPDEVLQVFRTGKGWDGSLDVLLGISMTLENLAGGMGTAALVSLLMALCNREASATHYALLSALSAVGRVYVGPTSGYLVESLGWAHFFELSMLVGVPGLLLLWRLRLQVEWLDTPRVS